MYAIGVTLNAYVKLLLCFTTVYSYSIKYSINIVVDNVLHVAIVCSPSLELLQLLQVKPL